MIGPYRIILAGLAVIAIALMLPEMGAFFPLGAIVTLAGAALLLRAFIRKRRDARQPQNLIVIDGSNAMHWKDGTPQIATLREIIRHLSRQGYTPGVVFDANAGFLLTGSYQHNTAFANLLGLPTDRVLVVAKGEPADPTILAAARFLKARIVTNDRYRDWVESHPELRQPGYLIRGDYRAGKLWLDLDGPDG